MHSQKMILGAVAETAGIAAGGEGSGYLLAVEMAMLWVYVLGQVLLLKLP